MMEMSFFIVEVVLMWFLQEDARAVRPYKRECCFFETVTTIRMRGFYKY